MWQAESRFVRADARSLRRRDEDLRRGLGVPLIALERGNAKMMWTPTIALPLMTVWSSSAWRKGRCARSRHKNGRAVTSDFSRQSVALNHYYFYVHASKASMST